MKLRILVFDDDPVMRDLIKQVLSSRGHSVHVFNDPSACPIYQQSDCLCPQDRPCADVVLVDSNLATMSGIDFLLQQRKRGCKALAENKALMSNKLTQVQRRAAEMIGVYCMAKPFKLYDLFAWIDQCAARIDEGRQLADLELSA